MREGSYVNPTKKILSEFLDEWFEIHKQGLEHNTIVGYKYNIKHINSKIGSKHLQSLSPADIEKMYKDLNLSGKYLQEIHSTLNLALKYAVKNRLISFNPIDVVSRPKKIKYQAGFVRPDQVKDYLNVFKDCWAYPAVALAMFCGLRRGEVLALKWEDVNYSKMQISIKHAVIVQDNELVLKKPKNNQTAIISMPPSIARILKEYRKLQSKNKLLLGEEYKDSDYIIREDNGTRPKPSYLSRFFNRRITSSGLSHIRFHDLRHTTASLLIMEGIDLKTVSEILRHSSVKITGDLYGHVIEEHKRQAANKLNKYLN